MKLFGIEFGKKNNVLLEPGNGIEIGVKKENLGQQQVSNQQQEIKEQVAEQNTIKVENIIINEDTKRARESATIKYSPTKTIQIGVPIEMKLLMKVAGENNEEKTYPLVYKYKIDNQQYEVVIGQISNCENLSETAKKIIDLFRMQLVNNAQGKPGLEQAEKIAEMIQANPRLGVGTPKVPFEYTMEGMNIITQKDLLTKEYPRTQILRETTGGLEIDGLYTKKEVAEMRKQKTQELVEEEKIRKEIEIQKRAKEKGQQARNKNLGMLSKEVREQYLIGEKIATYVSEKNKCNNFEGLTNFCKIAVSEFMIENHENEKNEQMGVKSSLENYVELKEKGFATDVIETLNQIQDTIYDSISQKIDEDKIDSIDRRVKKMEEIQQYRLLFKLLESGKKSNFDFLTKYKDLKLNELAEMFEKCGIRDEEVIGFLESKQKVVDRIDPNIGITLQDYKDEDGIVKDYYKFMVDSNIRKSTKEQEENMIMMESDVISTVMIDSNKKPMIVYSKIAGNSSVYNYDTKKIDLNSISPSLESKVLPKMITDVYKVNEQEIENYQDSNLRYKSLNELWSDKSKENTKIKEQNGEER